MLRRGGDEQRDFLPPEEAGNWQVGDLPHEEKILNKPSREDSEPKRCPLRTK
jgi:hypothetical protein